MVIKRMSCIFCDKLDRECGLGELFQARKEKYKMTIITLGAKKYITTLIALNGLKECVEMNIMINKSILRI